MKHSFSEIDKKLLKKIHSLVLELEKIPTEVDFPEEMLMNLNFLLGQFSLSENRGLQKLAQIPDHIYPQMDKRQFYHYIVPIERLLDRAMRDDHFLITKEDRSKEELVHQKPDRPLIFVLDHLRSAFNVGSIFRLADGFAIKEIHLLGYTPGPENMYVKKTALGTLDFVPSYYFGSWKESFQKLKNSGYKIVALETAQRAIPLTQAILKGPHAFVIGNERFGLPIEILDSVEDVVQIPMKGYKNSLNVANALSIATFEWERQNWLQIEGTEEMNLGSPVTPFKGR